MSVHVMALVFDLELPPNEKFVLLALGDHADEYGNNVYPSLTTVCRKTSMTRRTAQRAIGGLRSRGVLVPVPSDRRTNEYRIVIAGLATMTEPSAAKCPKGLRLEVIVAFRQRCVYCGVDGDSEHGPDGQRWNVDRILPASKGGEYVRTNVTLSCGTCNRKKGAKLAPSPPPALSDLGVPDRHGGDATVTPEPSVEPSAPSPKGSGAPADQIWDTLVATIGDPPRTRPERAKWNKAAKDLREADVTPEEIRSAVDAYGRHPTFKDCALTPLAIVTNLSTLLTWARPAQASRADDIRRRMAERGIA